MKQVKTNFKNGIFSPKMMTLYILWKNSPIYEVIPKLINVFLASEQAFKSENPKYIIFECRRGVENYNRMLSVSQDGSS